MTAQNSTDPRHQVAGLDQRAVGFSAPPVLPGTEIRHRLGLLHTELGDGDVAALSLLPQRGHYASLTGRAIAGLSELYAELTSYGWRLTQRPGADVARASTLREADVDTLADVRGERAESGHQIPNTVAVTLLGPVSLAATLHLPGGEKVLIDHGARRDLAQSLSAGTAEHLAHLRRSTGAQRLRVVVYEPDMGRVRRGDVPTVSGYRTIRSLPRDEVRSLVGEFLGSLRSSGADEVFLDVTAAPSGELVEDFRSRDNGRLTELAVDGFSLNAGARSSAEWEQLAQLVEDQSQLILPLLHPGETGHIPQVSQLASRLHEPWQALGMPTSSWDAFTLTPCAVEAAEEVSELSDAALMRAVTRVRDTASALTDQMESH